MRGAGKLQIATVETVAVRLALTMPEAVVFGLAETPKAEIDPASAKELFEEIASADAVLVWPSMAEETRARTLSLAMLKMD